MSGSAEHLVIQRIRAWRQSGWSYRAIAAALNEADVATKAGGGQWHPTTVRKIVLNDVHEDMPKAA